MYKYACRLVIALVCLACAPASGFALDTELLWRVGSDVVIFKERVERAGAGFSAVLTTSVGEYDSLELDARRSTLSWVRRSGSDGTDISARREGSTVRIRGTHQGKPYDRSHDIGDLPWYQLHEISYEELYAAGAASGSFWTVDRKTLKPTEFHFERLGEEPVLVMGARVPAIKYSLTVRGVPAFLFRSHFWLRKTDGRFLRLEVPPVLGLPRSSVELTAESR